VLGANQSGLRSSLDSLRVLRDEDTIVAARGVAEEMVAEDPTLARWPLLAAEVDVWQQDRKSDFMERS
jgi:ATP-dependent DNA helicase RecG